MGVYIIRGNKGKYGIINQKGEVIVEPSFACATLLEKDYVLVTYSGEWIFEPGIPDFILHTNRKKNEAILNSKGEVVIPPIYERITGTFSDNLCVVTKDGKCGCVNEVGEMVINNLYNGISPFSEGLAAFNYEARSKRGYINVNGEIAIKPQFDIAYEFKMGRAVVEVNNRNFIIDKTGEILQEIDKEDAIRMLNPKVTPPFNFYTVMVHGENKIGIYNQRGEILIEAKYDGIGKYSEGLLPVSWDVRFEENAPPFHEANYGGGDYHYISEDDYYASIDEYSDDHITMQKQISGKGGFISIEGKLIIEDDFYELNPFENGLALVRIKNERYAYIDKYGKSIWENSVENYLTKREFELL